MLTLVINPGGRPRIVKIVEALFHLGVDINRPHHCPEMTPEELRLRKMARRRERRRRLQERREAKR
ncbi:MAG: hypothetical protein ABFC89_12700 [Methanospirillum sp.]